MLPLQASPAYRIHSTLQAKWQDHLTKQDGQKVWPHVTICNKVSEEEANHKYALATSSFKPLIGFAIGLRLFKYKGGPWQLIRTFPFKGT
jgi:hypothetical protein